MKKCVVWLVVVVLIISPVGKARSQDPITLVIQQAITKVIKAVDLKIQRLQNRTIWLQNAQKVIENAMSKLKLDEISDWVEKQRVLYKDYFEELQKVKLVVTYYHKVKEIGELQLSIVKAYKKSIDGIQKDFHFSSTEVDYMRTVYAAIIEESLQNLDGLTLVLNSFTTQMTDQKRLEIIAQVRDKMQKNYDDLRRFSSQNAQLSMARAKDKGEILIIKNLYGL